MIMVLNFSPFDDNKTFYSYLVTEQWGYYTKYIKYKQKYDRLKTTISRSCNLINN